MSTCLSEGSALEDGKGKAESSFVEEGKDKEKRNALGAAGGEEMGCITWSVTLASDQISRTLKPADMLQMTWLSSLFLPLIAQSYERHISTGTIVMF